MAFKMKGSAFKLGSIQGTSGHASALKQGALTQEEIKRQQEERMRKYIERKERGLPGEEIIRGTGLDTRTDEERRIDQEKKDRQQIEIAMRKGAEIGGALPMKSALKQNLEQEQDLTTMSIEELKALSHKLIAEAEEKARNSMYWEDTGDDEYTKQDQKMLINEYTTNEDYNPDAAVLRQIVEIMKGKQESGEI